MTLPPGASGWPLLGETRAFLRDPRFVDRRVARYGPIFRTSLFGRPTVIAVGAEPIQQILMHPDTFHFKEGLPLHAQQWLGDSLLTQEGPAHQRSRRLLAAAFQPAAAAAAVPIFQPVIDQHLQRWSGAGPIDITAAARELTFALVSRFVLGAPPAHAAPTLVRDFEQFFAGLIALPLPIPGSRYDRARRAIARIRPAIAALVEQRRVQAADDMVSRLLHEHGATITTEEIVNHVLMLLMAGHETTATLVVETIVLLGTHPGWLAQLHRERASLPPALTAEQLGQWTTLTHIIQEVGRLYPPGHNGFRRVMETTQLGDFTIPRGWTCVYRSVETQRDPAVFADPHSFTPDRFAPPHGEPTHPFHMLTFGGGPRICLGRFVGLTMVQQILATLLQMTSWTADSSLLARLDQARAVYHNFPVRFIARQPVNTRARTSGSALR